MAVPKAVRQKLLDRLDSLISESKDILKNTEERKGRPKKWMLGPGEQPTFEKYEVVDASMMVSWTTKCVNVLSSVVPRNSPNRSIIEDFQNHGEPKPELVKYLVGRLSAIRDDFRDGFLDDAWSILTAEIASDYLTQAETLLHEGYHVPAAVLAGAVLEGSLRTECDNQAPPIPTVTANGKPKTLNIYIDDLKKASVYNEARAKELRAWADIRNLAAHGRPEEFTPQQVSNMLSGIQSLLAHS